MNSSSTQPPWARRRGRPLTLKTVNKLTKQIVDLHIAADWREKKAPNVNHGLPRHKIFVEQLRLKAEYLEKKRMLLLNAFNEELGDVKTPPR